MKKYSSVETKIEHIEITNMLKGKIIDKVTKVNCDEGLTIHFIDGTKLEFGYSGCEGETAINNDSVDVCGCNG